MNARELERLMVETFGPDFRDKVIVGPLGSFPLADCFAECGLEDPRAPVPTFPPVLLLMQPPSPASFPEHPATVEAQIRWGMEYIRQRYGAFRPWSGYASGVAINVGDSQVVKVVDNVLSPREVRVRNTGPDAVMLSKNPQVTATSGFSLALDGLETIWLVPGEALYAICASGDSAALGVL